MQELPFCSWVHFSLKGACVFGHTTLLSFFYASHAISIAGLSSSNQSFNALVPQVLMSPTFKSPVQSFPLSSQQIHSYLTFIFKCFRDILKWNFLPLPIIISISVNGSSQKPMRHSLIFSHSSLINNPLKESDQIYLESIPTTHWVFPIPFYSFYSGHHPPSPDLPQQPSNWYPYFHSWPSNTLSTSWPKIS